MKLMSLDLYATFENDAETKNYSYLSPKRERVKGIRMRIGWVFFRIGVFVLYGNRGKSSFN